jgi:hypothetical protein
LPTVLALKARGRWGARVGEEEAVVPVSERERMAIGVARHGDAQPASGGGAAIGRQQGGPVLAGLGQL